jgi:hypothetical protein
MSVVSWLAVGMFELIKNVRGIVMVNSSFFCCMYLSVGILLHVYESEACGLLLL